MDWYTVLKFLHIVAAVIWLGGGFTLLVAGLMARAAGNAERADAVMQSVAALGPVVFMPASMLTLVFGVAMLFFGQSVADLWVILGLFGFGATFCAGLFGIKPRAEKLAAWGAAGYQGPEVAQTVKEILQISKFDFVILFCIVALMVLKPSYGDTLLLGVMAAVLIAGAAMFLTPLFRRGAEPMAA